MLHTDMPQLMQQLRSRRSSTNKILHKSKSKLQHNGTWSVAIWPLMPVLSPSTILLPPLPHCFLMTTRKI